MVTYMGSYKNGDTADIKVMRAVQKGMPHGCYHGNAGRVCSVTQYAVGIVINKQVKGKILAKKMPMCVEHIKPPHS